MLQNAAIVGPFNVTGNRRTSRINVQLTKVGLNYRFNAGPVVARY